MDGTTGSPGSAESALVDALVQVSFAVTAVLTEVAADHDLSLTQLRLLGILRGRTPTLSDLAERLGLDRSSVSGLVDRAVARELVTRVPSEIDRRSSSVELTASGRQLGAELAATVVARVDALAGSLTPSARASLNRLLRATSVTVG